MKNWINLLTLFLVLQVNYNSAKDFDSLEMVCDDVTIDDNQRLEAMNTIAWNKHLFRNPDSGFYYAQKQYDLAFSVGNKKQMANA
jgi:hypothetical protein